MHTIRFNLVLWHQLSLDEHSLGNSAVLYWRLYDGDRIVFKEEENSHHAQVILLLRFMDSLFEISVKSEDLDKVHCTTLSKATWAGTN